MAATGEEGSALARARACWKQGDSAGAARLIAGFARAKLDLDCTGVVLRADEYSLNSLSGILTLGQPFAGQLRLFFKYHQEEDESKGVAEYYNSKLLENAGLPVDVPLVARSLTGEQILLYRVRTDARLADVCRDLEGGKPAAFTFEEVVAAQGRLDEIVGQKYLETLRAVPGEQAAAESLHQLFFYRLVDGAGGAPRAAGGRLRSFYVDQDFELPGLSDPLPWRELAALRWRINGRLHDRSLGELFQEAGEVLAPANLPASCPVVTGHGDAHNANVWIERHAGEGRLVYFDPAFAGANLPALLAEIKATFHNIFAHPDWLYHPGAGAARLRVSCARRGNVLEVETDWTPGALRLAFLESKIEHVWRPLLRAMTKSHPGDFARWERYIRLALFCCPTLVMNLRAGGGAHGPLTSATGLAIAVMCGSPDEDRGDPVSEFISRVRP